MPHPGAAQTHGTPLIVPPRLSSLETVTEEYSMDYNCTLNGMKIVGHLDPGATDRFIDPNEAKRLRLPITPHEDDVELGDGSFVRSKGTTTATLNMNGLTSPEHIYVLPMSGNTKFVIGKKWLQNHNPNIDWRTEYIRIKNLDGSVKVIVPRTVKRDARRVSMKRISIKAMTRLVRKQKAELFAIRVHPSMKDVTVSTDFKDLVSEYDDIFKGELPNTLPPRRDIDFEIHLKKDEPPPVRPVIRISPDELVELKKQLQDLLSKRLIRPSSSPFGAPIFFVKKKEGDLRMVCDYRALNRITITDSNPVPLISEALDQVSGACISSKIDLLGAYHQMRIREEDIPKTAIRTRYGSFEWRVLCFGLTNAPASFTRLLSTLLRELNGECLVLFLDDVLVYSKSREEHAVHLRRLFDLLRKNQLYAKRSKCVIGASEVEFLGHIVSEHGIAMQDRLKDAIIDWPTPKSVKEVQQFIGLANYYRKFILGYAKILQPISDIVRKHKFEWTEEQESSFVQLKTALTTAPVLAHPASDKEFVISTDASKYAVGATLEQDGRPVAYLSHRLSDAERNWDTGDQELLAFMIALRHWDIYLRGRKFTFRTDHEPIRYLQTKARLSGRQARWLDVLQSYTYDTQHVPGRKNVVPDALSRRPDQAPSIRKLEVMEDDWLKKVKCGYENDEFSHQMIMFLQDEQTPTIGKVRQQASNYEYTGDYLLWKGTETKRIYVPDTDTLRFDIIGQFHSPAHLGTDKTYPKLTSQLYWPGMYADTERYCAHCHDCQLNKVPNTAPAGKLQSHEIPGTVWDVVTMDFLTELPQCKAGFDSVFVIVEKLSKRAVFIPTTKTVTAPEAAQLLQDTIFSKHGIPVKIISDRDPKFKSNFWQTMMQLLNVKLNISTADHPQTDGQSEAMIRTLSNMIRKTVQEDKDNWHEMLSTLEFEYNSSKNASTTLTPFEVDLGRNPHNPLTRKLEDCGVRCQSAADMVDKMNSFRTLERDKIAEAQSRQRYYADAKRRDLNFKEADLVLLRNETLSTSKRSGLPTKWRSKYLGPLKITKVIGPVDYRVELPPSMQRAHNVFHVSKLRKYKEPLGRKGPLSVVIDADGTVEQEVEAILRKKKHQRRIYYLVQFMDDPESEAVWLPKSELTNCKELIKRFEESMRTSIQEKGECNRANE